MAKVVIEINGTKFYYDDADIIHRTNGPAIILLNGTHLWFDKGKTHRVDGPATFNPCGIYGWRILDKSHRVNGPAWDYPNGKKLWCNMGEDVWPELG